MRSVLAVVSFAVFCHCAAIGQRVQPVSIGFGAAQFMMDVLAKARVSGSLEYNGRCGPDFLVPDLPSIFGPEKPYAQNPADTFRSMFAVDPRMVVSQETNGTIRVVESGVQTDILHVKISHLTFNRASGPDKALHLILTAPELQSFMQTHGIGQPFDKWAPSVYEIAGMKTAPPMPGVRSISGELNNVTLADALDYVLKTFPGFWLYQDCQGPDGQRLVYFGLFPVPGRMWSWGHGVTLVR